MNQLFLGFLLVTLFLSQTARTEPLRVQVDMSLEKQTFIIENETNLFDVEYNFVLKIKNPNKPTLAIQQVESLIDHGSLGADRIDLSSFQLTVGENKTLKLPLSGFKFDTFVVPTRFDFVIILINTETHERVTQKTTLLFKVQ